MEISFDPTITLGHIFQLVILLMAAAAAYFRLDKRIELVRSELRHVWRTLDGLPCNDCNHDEKE